VLSRFLSGGRVLLAVAFGATIAAYVIGGSLGLLAGYRRGVVDAVSLGVVDVFIAIPPIILSLVLVAAIGGGVAGIALAVMVVQIPPVMRLVRSFTAAVAGLEYVEAARSRGETLWSILFREILPNIRVPLLADVGIRTSWSIILFASLSFLGLGQAPPAADWGLMISENREAILITPLVVVVPALALACLSVSINLTADSLARSIGRSSGGRNA
jgi:ABC-type dipeptide/oligopeptide/nickel transport system permease subunit